MVRKARIRLISSDPLKLDEVCGQIKEVATKTGVHSRGPIPLPTRKLQVPTRKSPCGQGTNTWDKWEMRIHKRMIDVDADERTMRQIMHIRVPEDVHIEIELT